MTPEEEMELEKNKNIQAMLNDFLLEKHQMDMNDFLKNSGEREILGVLTATHKLMLQQMVKNKFPNINELISQREDNNEGQLLGFMSIVEWELVEDLLNAYTEEKDVIPDVEYLVESHAKAA